MNKINICLVVTIGLLLINGCTKEVIKEVPKTEYKYPILKIADCDGVLIVGSMENLSSQYDSKGYKGRDDLIQFFYNPMMCSYKYNWSSPNCVDYADSLLAYKNCSIYYLNTSILKREE